MAKQKKPVPKAQSKSNNKKTNKPGSIGSSGVVEPHLITKENKYRLTKYKLFWRRIGRRQKPSICLEVEGLTLLKRSTVRTISFFECESHRRRNDPVCDLRACIIDLDLSKLEGEIEIMKDHSSTCKYIPGNETKDYDKNKGLSPSKKNYRII